MEIAVTILVIIALILIIQFYLRRSSQKDKMKLGEDWKHFQIASDTSDIKGINSYGDNLIWNKQLKQNQLTKIIEVVDSHIDTNPQLEKLKLDAFNKQVHYNRNIPTLG